MLRESNQIIEQVGKRRGANENMAPETVAFLHKVVERMAERRVPLTPTRMRDEAVTAGVGMYGFDGYVLELYNDCGTMMDFEYFLNTHYPKENRDV